MQLWNCSMGSKTDSSWHVDKKLRSMWFVWIDSYKWKTVMWEGEDKFCFKLIVFPSFHVFCRETSLWYGNSNILLYRPVLSVLCNVHYKIIFSFLVSWLPCYFQISIKFGKEYMVIYSSYCYIRQVLLFWTLILRIISWCIMNSWIIVKNWLFYCRWSKMWCRSCSFWGSSSWTKLSCKWCRMGGAFS